MKVAPSGSTMSPRRSGVGVDAMPVIMPALGVDGLDDEQRVGAVEHRRARGYAARVQPSGSLGTRNSPRRAPAGVIAGTLVRAARRAAHDERVVVLATAA